LLSLVILSDPEKYTLPSAGAQDDRTQRL